MSMVTYNVYLETYPNGMTLALVLDLPGCYASGSSETEAMNRLRMAVPDYFRWLSLQDAETPTMTGDIEFVIRERLPVTTGLYEVHPFFVHDGDPVADDDLDWGLALMSYAHTDLRRLTQTLDDGTLDWVPPHGEGGRPALSIRQIIDHLAQNEIWLATRLDTTPKVPEINSIPGVTLERYDRIHEQAMLRLSDAPPEWRSIITEHNGEKWSMRKVLRRSIWRERSDTELIAVILGQRASGS